MKTPTNEQLQDAAHLVRTKWACLFSEPGTGKTLTAITARQALPANLRTLVIAPKIAVGQWQAELQDQGIDAAAFRDSKAFRNLQHETVVVTTWTLMATNRAKLEDWAPEVIIADESHAAMDYKAQRTKAFFGDRKNEALATGAEWCWMLTGTPIVRFADDLWPMLNAMFPAVLYDLVSSRRRQAFMERYVGMENKRIRGGRVIAIPAYGKNEDELNEAIYDKHKIAVRRKLADVDKDLPVLRERVVEVDLDEDAEASLNPLLAGLSDDDLRKDTEVVKSIRRAFGRGKVASAIEYLRTINEPVLVLTWHRDVTEAIAWSLSDKGIGVIHGGTDQKQREATLAAFSEGHAQYLIGQIGAVGTALDGLQHACHRVVFVERIGSPALMDQAIARVQRRGQRESVQVEYLRVPGHRLEYVTDGTLNVKRDTQDRAIG